MKNTFTYGYVSEKLFSSLFAGSMPIYFGPTDISRYINLDRIIFCHVSEIAINRMRFIFNVMGRDRISLHLQMNRCSLLVWHISKMI